MLGSGEHIQLVDEPDEEPTHSEPEPEHQGEGEELDMERAIQMKAIRPLSVVEEVSTGPSTQPQDDTSANIVRDTPSPTDAKTKVESDKTNSGGDTEILQITEELGEDVTNQVNLEEKIAELDQDQVGSDPGESLESQPQPEQVHMDKDRAGPDPKISYMALAGPDPKPTYNEFMADLYPKVQEI
ncbi:hypothetical protein Tco_0568893 [Tanacetum coccineum]